MFLEFYLNWIIFRNNRSKSGRTFMFIAKRDYWPSNNVPMKRCYKLTLLIYENILNFILDKRDICV